MLSIQHRIDHSLGRRGLPGVNAKLVVEDQDVYVKVAFYCDPGGVPKLAHIDVTLSSAGGAMDVMVTARDARNEATKTDNARAMIEMLCRQANALLASGVWEAEDLMDAWAGTTFDPKGQTKFPKIGGEEWKAIVSSPLDAVVRLLRARLATWEALIGGQDGHADDGGDTGADCGAGGAAGASE